MFQYELKTCCCYLFLNKPVQKKEENSIKIAPSDSDFQDFKLATKAKCLWHSVLFLNAAGKRAFFSCNVTLERRFQPSSPFFCCLRSETHTARSALSKAIERAAARLEYSCLVTRSFYRACTALSPYNRYNSVFSLNVNMLDLTFIIRHLCVLQAPSFQKICSNQRQLEFKQGLLDFLCLRLLTKTLSVYTIRHHI